MQPNNPMQGFRNENCIVQRNLGVPLYYRCTYCNKTSSDCLGMQFNLTTGIIIVLLLLTPLIGDYGHIIAVVIATALLLRLGVLVNKENDDLLINHHNLDIKNRELSLLLDAANAIADQLDLDQTLDILAERIVTTISCTYVRILVSTDEGKKLIVRASNPARQMEWKTAFGHAIEVTPGSILETALAANEPIVLESEQIQEIRGDELLGNCLLGCSSEIQSMLVAPIRMHEECLGLIVLGESRCPDRVTSMTSTTVSAISLVKYAGMAAGIAIKNSYHYQMLHKAHLEAIMCLGETLETRDAYTRGHSDRTVGYAMAIARKLSLMSEEQDRLQFAAALHDVGKIGIPDSVLNKPGKLTDEEYTLMKTHSEKGEQLAAKIRSLEHIAPLIRHHHERWDGGGYPDGLAGEEIPIESRIVAVLDAYDAMTSDRIYRTAPGNEFAVDELQRCSGSQFDPRVVDAFLKVLQAEHKAEAEAYTAIRKFS